MNHISATIIGIFITCQSLAQNAKSLDKYGLSDSLMKNWKKDKDGCLNLRCKYIDTLRNNKAIIGMPLKTFQAIFGKPTIKVEGDCYTYQICTECDHNHKKIGNFDSAWMVFCFEDDRLKKCVLQIE